MLYPQFVPIFYQIQLANNPAENVFLAIDNNLDFLDTKTVSECLKWDECFSYLVAYVCSNTDRATRFFNAISSVIFRMFINQVLNNLNKESSQTALQVKQELINPLFILLVNLESSSNAEHIADKLFYYIHSFKLADAEQESTKASMAQQIARIQNAVKKKDYSEALRSAIVICGSLIRRKMYTFCDEILDHKFHNDGKSQILACLQDAPGFYVEYFSANQNRVRQLMTTNDAEVLQDLYNKSVNYLARKNVATQPEYTDEMINVALMIITLSGHGNVKLGDTDALKSALLNLMQLNATLNSSQNAVIFGLEAIIQDLVEHLGTAAFSDTQNENMLHHITKFNSADFLKFLLSLGADLRQKATNSTTAVLSKLIYHMNDELTPVIEEALANMPDGKAFLENEIYTILARFDRVTADEQPQKDYILEIVPMLLKILVKVFAPYDNLALMIDEQRSILERILRTEWQQNYYEEIFLLRSIFKTFTHKSLDDVLLAIKAEAGEYQYNKSINTLTQSLLLESSNAPLEADYNFLIWDHLAKYPAAAQYVFEHTSVSFMHTCGAKAEDLAEWFRDSLVSPFLAAKNFFNVSFLLFVAKAFSQPGNLDIAKLISDTAVDMIVTKADIAKMQPLIAYLRKLNDGFLCLPGSKSVYVNSILKPIERKIAKVRPSKFEACIPSRKSSRPHLNA